MNDDPEIEVPEGWGTNALELVESAHIACRGAWLWPEDHEQREIAVIACAQCGVDYILQLEKIVGIITGPLDKAIDRGRREMAEAFRKWADRLYLERETGIQHIRDATDEN